LVVVGKGNVLRQTHLRAAVFRLVADVGLETGLATVFLTALAGVDLLSGDFFALDAGVLEAGFFPVTSLLAVSRREETVVFFAVAALVVDFEEGFNGFLRFDFVLELVFAGLATTLGSLTTFFTVDFFVVSLVTVSFLEAGFFAAGDFVALVAVVLDLDLEDLAGAGAFFVEVALDAFAGLFSLVSMSLFLTTVFGGSLTRPERPLGR